MGVIMGLMMQQLTLDSAHGEALKREGQASVASANAEFMGLVREEAIRISRQQGQVDMDALRLWAEARGLKPTHCNIITTGGVRGGHDRG